MVPTNPHNKPETTKVGEEVLDLPISYIHNADDRSSVSLVSRNFYEIDRITRKHLTVHALYCPNPATLSKRFPFIEALSLKGPETGYYGIRITPWIELLSALEFSCLKELHIRCLVIHDEDLETLARTRGKDLRILKIKMCEGFSTDGLMHVSKYCNQLRTLCLGYINHIDAKDGIWFHQLALNSTVLERLHIRNTDIFSVEDLTLLAKNCCNSLISLKIGSYYLSELRDAFRYSVRLEHFGGVIWDDKSGLVGFQFSLNMRSFSVVRFPVIQYSSLLPLLNQIRKLKFVSKDMDEDIQCSLYKRCPNLEVLYTDSGDRVLQVLGQFCKKLHKLANCVSVTQVGMIALAKGCSNLDYFEVTLRDISNEALECVGTHLKNLLIFRMGLVKKDGTTDLPLDNGVRAMLMGCSKLEKLDITLWHGGLIDVGLECVGKYGANLRSLSLTRIGISNAGLVKLSQGCPRLRKLKLKESTFRQQAVASIVFNMPSLRYLWLQRSDHTVLALVRPDFQL